jgi:hypothetical protein
MNIKAVALFVLLISTTASSLAETSCKNDVTYSWKKGEEAESTIFFETVQASAGDEAQAKSNLLEKTTLVKMKASEACRKIHENTSACISAKLTSSSSMLSSLTFSSRKAVEDAATADCQKQAGKCSAISSSEPVCAAAGASSGQASASPTPEAKAAGKGKK